MHCLHSYDWAFGLTERLSGQLQMVHILWQPGLKVPHILWQFMQCLQTDLSEGLPYDLLKVWWETVWKRQFIHFNFTEVPVTLFCFERDAISPLLHCQSMLMCFWLHFENFVLLFIFFLTFHPPSFPQIQNVEIAYLRRQYKELKFEEKFVWRSNIPGN